MTETKAQRELTPILDVTAGSRMFWFDKENPNATFLDQRSEEMIVKDNSYGGQRHVVVHPDVIGDFRNLPFEDNSFSDF